MKAKIRYSILSIILAILLLNSGKQTTGTVTYYGFFGQSGILDGEFTMPDGIFDNGTHLIIADAFNDRIQIFNKAGVYQDQVVSSFNLPRDVKGNSTHFFVADTRNHIIKIFDHDWIFKGTIGSSFNQPAGIAVNSSHILICDSGNNRIQIYNHAGQLEDSITGLSAPQKIDFYSDRWYIAESLGNRVVIMFQNGTIFDTIGSGSVSSNLGDFSQANGIAVHPSTGIIYVSDTYNDRLQVFDSLGNFVAVVNGSAHGVPGSIERPFGLSINETHLMVSETGSNKVLIFLIGTQTITETETNSTTIISEQTVVETTTATEIQTVTIVNNQSYPVTTTIVQNVSSPIIPTSTSESALPISILSSIIAILIFSSKKYSRRRN